MAAGIRCLLEEDPDEAARLAGQLDELNRQRQDLQVQMQGDAMRQVQTLLAELAERELPPALCLFDESWHQGIVGLVASRVKDAVHRPVVAFAPAAEGSGLPEGGLLKSGLLKGSARSVRGLHIRDVLARVDAATPGLIRAFGGHAMAAGLSLERDRLPAFQESLAGAVTAFLGGATLAAEVWTDGELAGDELGLPLAAQLEDLGPWGQRFPEPVFEGAFDIVDRRLVGGAHLKLLLRSRDGGQPLDAIAFNRRPEDLANAASVRILYRLAVNRWRNSESCQLVIEDIVD
jgi:single-stranded-DNA-specific exonuclease